jgi:hypothetical protein
MVRDVCEEGWQAYKRGLQVSTTGGPFFDENPRFSPVCERSCALAGDFGGEKCRDPKTERWGFFVKIL